MPSVASSLPTDLVSPITAAFEAEYAARFGEALRLALLNVVGAYAIVAISKNFPNQMVAARKSSPLVVGIGAAGDFYLASDATPIVEYTKQVVYLEDEEIAVIKLGEELKIYNISDQEKKYFTEIHAEQIEILSFQPKAKEEDQKELQTV